MPFGYTGKILKVDLSRGEIEVDEPEDKFYRKYMGGSALGTYYLLSEQDPGVDPLGPENQLVFSLSVLTGAPLSGLSRFNVTSKSPLTGAIGDSQAGGWFPSELKFAGFDAVVIRGQADRPVYLWIHDGEVQIRDASHLWGTDTLETEEAIREELDDSGVRVAAIGPGGENLVKYACILTEGKFAAGRTGMGAVMGSKKLKAVAVRGDRSQFEMHDRDAIMKLVRETPSRLEESSLSAISEMGSALGVTGCQAGSMLPTRNFQSGVFDDAEYLGGEHILSTIHTGRRDTCYGCAVHCKQVVAADEPVKVDPKYGAPEYETLAMLGSNLEIGDPAVVARGNELCNRYSIDTISTGAMIAFVMECMEQGIISPGDIGGIDLRFGDGEGALQLIEKIAHREGIGDVLADGYERALQVTGDESEPFALHVKWNPFPAHMPRVKRSLALAYAITPFGADHVSSSHDPSMAPSGSMDSMYALGIHEPRDVESMQDKARFFYYTQMQFSIYDTLEICARAYGLFGFGLLPDIVGAVTGWNATTWELMKAGERRWNMMRIFNAREGFTREQDILPPRMFEPLTGGDSDGFAIAEDEFEKAADEYYEMVGWCRETGLPTDGKIAELGLQWTQSHEDDGGGE